jgi:uncharacterized protein with PIN domain
MDERFVADRNLGKLAKWLRILGYDTVYDRADADRDFLRRADKERRIALTRKRELNRSSYPVRLVIVKADHVEGQLGEVIKALDLLPDPSRRMTRCLICNALLEEVEKAAVEGLVPSYVRQTCTRFLRCPLCGRIFWPGTHSRRVEEYLKSSVPFRSPSS